MDAIAACVRENATEGELALMALGGERAQTATAQVLQKPGTLDCLNRAGVQVPGLPASGEGRPFRAPRDCRLHGLARAGRPRGASDAQASTSVTVGGEFAMGVASN